MNIGTPKLGDENKKHSADETGQQDNDRFTSEMFGEAFLGHTSSPYIYNCFNAWKTLTAAISQEKGAYFFKLSLRI